MCVCWMVLTSILCHDTKRVHELYLVYWQWFESYFKVLYENLQTTEYLIQLIDKTRSSCNCCNCCWNLGKLILENLCLFHYLCSQSGHKQTKNPWQNMQAQEDFGPPILVSVSVVLPLFVHYRLLQAKETRVIVHNWLAFWLFRRCSHPSQSTCENNSHFLKRDIWREKKVYFHWEVLWLYFH